MKRVLVFVVLVLSMVSTVAHATKAWVFKEVYIKDVSFMHSNGLHGLALKISDVENDSELVSSFSCAATATPHNVVGYWNDSVNGLMQSLLSTALSAQAQGLKVDINVDPAACSNDSSWWDGEENAPQGLGLKVFGIRIRGN